MLRKISVNYNKVKGPRDTFTAECVGAGHACLGLRAGFLEHLRTVQRECGFTFLRFHGILHDDMDVYREDKDGYAIYNWQYIDLVYDAILDIGMKPFVEFTFMPRVLASGKDVKFWWAGNKTPPKDYDKWHDLIKAFTKHMEDRYGREEVTTWYFEVWNEPNLHHFWSGDMAEYFKLYDYSAKAIKAVCKDYRVGGPATAGNAWVPELINHCHERKIPLDFIATHTYGVRGDFDEFGNSVLYLSEDNTKIIEDVKKVKQQISFSPMPDLELHYTEWSSSYSSRDPVHDSYVQAAYILDKLKGSEGHAESMSYWTFSDVFEEAGPPPSPFHGGFGLINLQGLKKPSFYAYKYLNKLGDEELSVADSKAWVCRSAEGVQALMWNFKLPQQDASNNEYFTRDLKAKPADAIDFKVSNLPKGSYTLKVHRIGYRNNDVFTFWLEAGSPKSPTRKQVKELEKKCNDNPVESEEVTITSKGIFKHKVEMLEYDIVLILLTKK